MTLSIRQQTNDIVNQTLDQWHSQWDKRCNCFKGNTDVSEMGRSAYGLWQSFRCLPCLNWSVMVVLRQISSALSFYRFQFNSKSEWLCSFVSTFRKDDLLTREVVKMKAKWLKWNLCWNVTLGKFPQYKTQFLSSMAHFAISALF